MTHGTLRKAIVCLSLSLFVWGGSAALAASRARQPQPVPAPNAVSLKDTVTTAVDYNPNIKAFQEYRQAAEHDLSRARNGWFPRVDARAGYGAAQVSDPTTRSHVTHRERRDYYDTADASITLSQIIWDGFATWNRVNVGESLLDSAGNRLLDNAEAIGLDALLAHIEVYRQRRISTLAEMNVKNHRTILASQKERQRSGASTLADVTQTQTRLARTEASLAETHAALEVALANYKRITGKEASELEAPQGPANAYPSLDVALAHSQSGNFKLKALTADTETAQHQTELDKAPFHPQLTFEMGPSYTYRSGSSLYDTGSMTFMLRAQWNLFNGGYDYFNVKGSKARARQSRQQLLGLYDDIAKEAETFWSDYISAKEQAKFYGNAVQFATQTRDLYLEQFNVGQRSLLDVLDSENELFSSSIQYVTAQQNVIAAQYRLLALGGELLPTFDVSHASLPIATEDAD